MTTVSDKTVPITTCDHCTAIRAELEQCKPLGPSGLRRYGSTPFWGFGPSVNFSSPSDRIRSTFFSVGNCACSCHDAWRMFTRNKVVQ